MRGDPELPAVTGAPGEQRSWLDRFQKEYDADMAVCESRKRDLRRLDALLTADLDEVKERRREQSTWLDEPEEEQERFRSHLRRTQAAVQPKQAGYTYYNPWNSEIMKSIWFFGK